MKRRTFLNTLLGGLSAGLLGQTRNTLAETGKRILIQESPLAGFQYHRASDIWQFMQMGDQLRLVREPRNRHDSNAIAVWFKNERLGYIQRKENYTLARMMEYEEKLEARIVRLVEDDNPWKRVRFQVFLR
jgi:hypothetical protein